MMGLRLTSKASRMRDWRKKFGVPLSDFIPSDKIARLQREGYLAADEVALKTTATGRQRLNAVLGFLVN